MSQILKQKFSNPVLDSTSIETLGTDFIEQGGVWIFPLSSRLQKEQEVSLLAGLTEFLGTWKSHRDPIKAEATLLYSQLLLVYSHSSLTEVGGCAKDALIRNVKNLVTALPSKLVPELDIVYWDGTSEELKGVSRYEVSALIAKGEWTLETPILRKELTTLGAVRTELFAPARACWTRTFFS